MNVIENCFAGNCFVHPVAVNQSSAIIPNNSLLYAALERV